MKSFDGKCRNRKSTRPDGGGNILPHDQHVKYRRGKHEGLSRFRNRDDGPYCTVRQDYHEVTSDHVKGFRTHFTSGTVMDLYKKPGERNRTAFLPGCLNFETLKATHVTLDYPDPWLLTSLKFPRFISYLLRIPQDFHHRVYYLLPPPRELNEMITEAWNSNRFVREFIEYNKMKNERKKTVDPWSWRNQFKLDNYLITHLHNFGSNLAYYDSGLQLGLMTKHGPGHDEYWPVCETLDRNPDGIYCRYCGEPTGVFQEYQIYSPGFKRYGYPVDQHRDHKGCDYRISGVNILISDPETIKRANAGGYCLKHAKKHESAMQSMEDYGLIPRRKR
jgi:hypothetical protein